MVSWLRRRRGVKTTGKAEDAAQWVDKQRQQAAEKLQAIQRGNKARAEALAKGVYQTGKGVVGFGLDTGKGVLGKGLDSTKMLLGEARTIADNDQIVAPTPAGAWFTPAVGWPQSVDGVAEWKPPTNLCPTRAEVPDLFDPSLTIGELRVEVLEALGLPALDRLTLSSDPYAMVLFERHAARTNVFKVTRNPKWTPNHPRAFRFDVTRPFSCCYIALKDHDHDSSDDDIGRVVLELSTLESNVQYDCWFELYRKTYKRPKGARGYLRLRYSVVFHSERQRFIRYAQPRGVGPLDPLPPFVIPMHKGGYVRNAHFASTGWQPGRKFKWRVFKSYLSEIGEFQAIDSAADALQDLIFWRGRTAPLSALVCIALQLLITYPTFLPATGPLSCLFLLYRNWAFRPGIQPRVGVVHQPRAGSGAGSGDRAGGQKTPTGVAPMLGALGRSLTLRTFNKDTSQSGVPRGGGPSQATAAALREAMDEGSDSDSDEEDKVVAAGGKGSYAHMRERLEIEYDEKLHTSLEATTGVETEESRLDETKDDRFTVHPLAPTLGPWQRKLAQLLKQVRNVRRVLSWEDTYVTAHITLAFVALLVIALVLPWGAIFHWGCRLVALLAGGPHMHFVGKRRDRAAKDIAAKELAYQEGTAATRLVLEEAVRTELEAKMVAKLDKLTAALRHRTTAQIRADGYLERHPHKLIIWPTRLSGRFRFRSTPILHLSRADPLVVAQEGDSSR